MVQTDKWLDDHHMRHALVLAERSLGQTAPNPAVGCVIVKDGVVVGRGRTAKGGRPHAETAALQQAGEAARGATAYVSLEPCAHYGQTLPCADALVAAGVARVVVGADDPDPRVNGRGLARLREAGIEVVSRVCAEEAAAVNAGFFLRVREGRPLVTLKIAQSLDGKTASAMGESQWITGAAARAFGHLMRARTDAILVGVGTALADDPMLTCRLPGLEDRSPLRVVLDARLRLTNGAKLVRTAREVPTLAFTTTEDGGALEAWGVEVIQVERDVAGRPRLDEVLADLARRGITRLLVEGGATVHAAFLNARLVDRLEVFTSPMALGAAGHSSVDALTAVTLGEAPLFKPRRRRGIGPDLLVSYVRGD